MVPAASSLAALAAAMRKWQPDTRELSGVSAAGCCVGERNGGSAESVEMLSYNDGRRRKETSMYGRTGDREGLAGLAARDEPLPGGESSELLVDSRFAEVFVTS